MKIKEEWRLAARQNVYGPFESAVPADEDQFCIDRTIEAIAPLIAAEVIDACAKVANRGWLVDEASEEPFVAHLRREVPKILFGEEKDAKPV